MLNRIAANFNNGKAFRIALFLLILLKLVLVMGYKMYAMPTEAGIDDSLMYRRAVSITNGEWLGPYDSLILAKGAFFSLWLSFLHVLSVPMLIGNELLYVAACLFMIFCIKNIIPNKKILSLIFAALLFNPATLLENVGLLRVYRDGIFPSLVMFVLAGMIGMFLNRSENKKMLTFSILAGFGLSAAWYTREDAFWVLPFVITAVIITIVFLVMDKNCKDRTRKIIYLVLPLFFLITSNLLVSSINFFAYGRFIANDYMSRDFQGAYGALTRVAHEEFDFYNPVPEEVRMKIYQVSPAFNEMKPFLDEGSFEGWKVMGKNNFNWPLHDYYSWFMWALREAVTYCGYYENPQKAKTYYKRLAREVNEACDNGLLPSRTGKRTTLAAPFSREYIKPTIKHIIDATLFVIKYENIISSTERMVRHISGNQIEEYRKIEYYLNQIAAYTYFTNIVEINGWTFDESENMTIRIQDNMNRDIDATIIRGDGIDVYSYFINNFNEIYETAMESRFTIKFYRNIQSDYFLILSNESGHEISIPIDGNKTVDISSSTIKYCLDNVDMGESSINYTRENNLKHRISNLIIGIYRTFNPIFTIISLLSLIILTGLVLYSLKEKTRVLLYEEVIILWGLLLLFLARTVMIAYISASSFPAINVLYLSSSYPIVIIFNCISMTCIIKFVKKHLGKIKMEINMEKDI
jgi:hypothetical protein